MFKLIYMQPYHTTYVLCMNIHLFNIVVFIFYSSWFFLPSFGWFSDRSVIFEWIHEYKRIHQTHTHIYILLIINAIAHSDEIIPASLFSPINIEFLCSRVHLSHIILCRLSCCCILFISGRLFYYVSPFSNGICTYNICVCVCGSAYGIYVYKYTIFHNIAFHARIKVFNNGFLFV